MFSSFFTLDEFNIDLSFNTIIDKWNDISDIFNIVDVTNINILNITKITLDESVYSSVNHEDFTLSKGDTLIFNDTTYVVFSPDISNDNFINDSNIDKNPVNNENGDEIIGDNITIYKSNFDLANHQIMKDYQH